MFQLEAIDRWCRSSSLPIHPFDLLFLSNKIQFRGTEDLTGGNTEGTLVFFYGNLPVSINQMKVIGITFF